jgi:hypothetical protein
MADKAGLNNILISLHQKTLSNYNSNNNLVDNLVCLIKILTIILAATDAAFILIKL